MQVNLPITVATEYFEKIDKEIDWDGNDSTRVSMGQYDALQEILTTEVSIYLLHRAHGVDGSLVDNMVCIRRKFINDYDSQYEPYIEFNNFY